MGIALAAHESSYRGGDYYRTEVGDADVILQINFVDDDGQRAEPDFQTHDLLLYLDGDAGDVDRLESKLSVSGCPVTVLRRSTY